MQPLDSTKDLRSRRKLLSAIASATGAAALAGLTPASAMAGTSSKKKSTEPATKPATPQIPEELVSPARFRNYKNRRSSSWDREGGNKDWIALQPGQTATLFDTQGAGVITHIWFTIASTDSMHLKNIVLRAWWDGETNPSIEAPVGDFFGLGTGEYFLYQSELLAVSPVKGLNAYFKMPFSSAARISVTNEGMLPITRFFHAIDYALLPAIPDDLGRFHAQYRQAAPCPGKEGDFKNLDGAGNYVFLEATGKGHYVGVTNAVMQNQSGWFGEGDDMIFIDGDTAPTINGTGAEDYFNGAWGFGDQPFAYVRHGTPFIMDPAKIGGRYCLYRWHTESPIAFEKSIRVTIEHGTGNNRCDNFYSTAYWYQSEPHAPFAALPPAVDRIPRVYAVGGLRGVASVPITPADDSSAGRAR